MRHDAPELLKKYAAAAQEKSWYGMTKDAVIKALATAGATQEEIDADIDDVIEYLAKRRVADTQKLEKYEKTIIADWPNWREHCAWVLSAKVAEITDWAKDVEYYSEEH